MLETALTIGAFSNRLTFGSGARNVRRNSVNQHVAQLRMPGPTQ